LISLKRDVETAKEILKEIVPESDDTVSFDQFFEMMKQLEGTIAR